MGRRVDGGSYDSYHLKQVVGRRAIAFYAVFFKTHSVNRISLNERLGLNPFNVKVDELIVEHGGPTVTSRRRPRFGF